MSSQLKQRLAVGSIGVTLLFVIIYFSYASFFKPIFVFFSAITISLALLEYYRLTRHKGFQPLLKRGLICSFLYVVATYLSLVSVNFSALPGLVLLAFFILSFWSFFSQRAHPILNLAITVFGLAYVTIPLSFLVKINYFFTPENNQDGRLWLAYVLLISKMTDMGAYFFGKLFGKNKLAPLISPKKTIEGSIGGLLTSLIASWLFYLFISPDLIKLTAWQSIWVACVLSVFAQFGDLAESLLKRDAGIKDSSNLPGLGGMLDIMDSLIFTLPLMYFILELNILG